MTCRGCHYFKEDRGVFTATGWTGDGSRGHCHVDPRPVMRNADAPACRYRVEKR